MTFIVGWKQNNSVFLCADTAITTNDVSLSTTTSSFGEAHIVSQGMYVGESAIKLINFKVAAAAICGDMAPARALLQEFSGRLEAGDTPMRAIHRAVASHTPLSPNYSFSLILALIRKSEPILLGFNIDDDQALTEVPEEAAIQFGSMPPKFKSVTAQFLNVLRHNFRNPSSRQLAVALGLLQSFGIHDYLLKEGVGGIYCGMYLTPEGVQWQGDILNVIYTPKLDKLDMVASIVRDNVLVVRANINARCVYFGDSLMGGIADEWKTRYWDEAFEHIHTGRFDFVNLLSKRNRTVTIAEMMRELKSDYVHVIPTPAPNPGQANFEISLNFSPTILKQMALEVRDRGYGTMPFGISLTPFSAAPH